MKPWEEDWAVDDDGCVYEAGDVASVADTWGVDDATQVARGRLIAAAPDLYRALKEIAGSWVYQRYMVPFFGKQVDAALAKARGER